MKRLMPEATRCERVLALAVAAGLAGYIAQALAPSVCGAAVTAAFETAVYPALVGAAGVLVLLRAMRCRRDRAAWALAGAGLVAWALGDAALALGAADGAGLFTIADGFWLAFYPAAYVAVLLLARARVGRGPGLWLDGLAAALAIAALVAALVWVPVTGAAELAGTLPLDLAYLLGDLVLLGLVAAAVVLLRWRPGRDLACLAGGLALTAAADGFFLYEAAAGLELTTTAPAALWPAGTLLAAVGASQPAAAARARAGRWATLATPGAAGAVALALLVYGLVASLAAAAAALATAALVLTLARVTVSFAENLRLLREAERQAATDALTGLGNRRALTAELARVLAHGEESALVMFDLDGFKHYNDAFGHPAGDALLARLGARFEAEMDGLAAVYRLGGDEFCALLHDGDGAREAAERAAEALSEHGGGFSVGASFGLVLLPAETREATAAMQIADRRLYEQKGERRRASVTRQTGDVLLQALHERQPDLRGHVGEVATLAAATAERLGLAADERGRVAWAAELHDVGKMAVPDAILGKAGPLDEGEWAFMRQHTVVGERILRAAPALAHVAPLVRASHERYDGTGYPDRLAGEEIPLGARIVAVCDAFHAITSTRPYSPSRRVGDAIAELRRCAGSQFDPAVVDAFCVALAEHGRRPRTGARRRIAAAA